MTAEFADQRLQVVRPQSPDVRDRTLIMMQPVQRLWQGTIHNTLIYEKYECAEYFFYSTTSSTTRRSTKIRSFCTHEALLARCILRSCVRASVRLSQTGIVYTKRLDVGSRNQRPTIAQEL